MTTTNDGNTMNIRHNKIARFTLSDGSTMEGTIYRPWWWWLIPAMWFVFRMSRVTFFDPRNGEPIPAAGFIMVYRRNVVFIQMEE